MTTPALRCSKCNAVAPAGARAGGTHYRRHAGIRGRNHDRFDRAVTCGTWVEVTVETKEVERG